MALDNLVQEPKSSSFVICAKERAFAHRWVLAPSAESVAIAIALLANVVGQSSLGAATQPPFVISSPAAGAAISPGDVLNIVWSGGNPNWSLGLYLIEATPKFPFEPV